MLRTALKYGAKFVLSFTIVCLLRTALNCMLRTSEGANGCYFQCYGSFLGGVHVWHHMWMVPYQENDMC